MRPTRRAVYIKQQINILVKTLKTASFVSSRNKSDDPEIEDLLRSLLELKTQYIHEWLYRGERSRAKYIQGKKKAGKYYRIVYDRTPPSSHAAFDENDPEFLFELACVINKEKAMKYYTFDENGHGYLCKEEHAVDIRLCYKRMRSFFERKHRRLGIFNKTRVKKKNIYFEADWNNERYSCLARAEAAAIKEEYGDVIRNPIKRITSADR